MDVSSPYGNSKQDYINSLHVQELVLLFSLIQFNIEFYKRSCLSVFQSVLHGTLALHDVIIKEKGSSVTN